MSNIPLIQLPLPFDGKVCTRCKVWRVPDDFSKSRHTANGRNHKCRRCVARYPDKYWERQLMHLTGQRRCHKCHRVKPCSEFHKRGASFYVSACRQCKVSVRRAHYEANKERARLQRRNWAQRNPEKNLIYARRFRTRHRDTHITYMRRYSPIKNSVRRARLILVGGQFTIAEWEALKARYDFRCLACGRCEPEIQLTVDHVIPISQGGDNTIANIQPLCLSCNSRKNVKAVDYRPRSSHRP